MRICRHHIRTVYRNITDSHVVSHSLIYTQLRGMRFLAWAVVLLLSCHPSRTVDICGNYPHPDPCLPGGEWDPALNRCSAFFLCVELLDKANLAMSGFLNVSYSVEMNRSSLHNYRYSARYKLSGHSYKLNCLLPNDVMLPKPYQLLSAQLRLFALYT